MQNKTYKISNTHEKEKEAMRDVYTNTLIELVEEGYPVVENDADFVGIMKTTPLQDKHPENLIDVGIMEQTQVASSAGMSLNGVTVFFSNFGSFVSRRSCHSLYTAAQADANVKAVGVDPGITGAGNGGSHESFNDMAFLRPISNITIMEPSDIAMLKWMIRKMADTHGVFYMRPPRSTSYKVYEEGSTFEIGKGNILLEGTDVTIIAIGSVMVRNAFAAAEILKEKGISARVVDMFTVKPLDVECVIESAKKTGAIVTAENHGNINGLGTAVVECLVDNDLFIPVEKISTGDRYGEVGEESYLEKIYKMTVDDVVAAAMKAVARK